MPERHCRCGQVHFRKGETERVVVDIKHGKSKCEQVEGQ